MEELYEILEDIIPGEDYKNSTALVDDDILTSFELVRLVTEIDSTFDISIPSSEIVPDNFNSVESIWALIERLGGARLIMALVSYGFGFFCAVLLLLYYIVPGRFQWRILLAASILFYGFAGPLWILYPAASSVSVWYLARKIGSMTDQYRSWVQKEQPYRDAEKGV